MILSKIRTKLTSLNLSALIVPHADAHMSEYLCASEERLAFVSNFTGSAGTAVITHNQALLWTDGRYFVQAAKELDSSLGWSFVRSGEPDVPSIEKWILEHFENQSPKDPKTPKTTHKIGLEADTASVRFAQRLQKEWKKSSLVELCILDESIVDTVWGDGRPNRTCNPVANHPISLAGKSVQEKLDEAKEKLAAKHADFMVVSALDEIAWALNLRGTDISYNPVFFGHLIVHHDGHADLFTDNAIADTSALAHRVRIHKYDMFSYYVSKNLLHKKVWLDLNATACSGTNALRIDVANVESSPLLITEPSCFKLPKSIKNQAEIKAMMDAQELDAVALTSFLAWIDAGNFKDEVHAAEKLAWFRKQCPTYLGPSFETISSVGANGAIVHYKPKPETSASAGNVLLMDSGGQYPGGTTDTTRTLLLRDRQGVDPNYVAKCYTGVLKGHIQLALTVFPKGCHPHRLDALTRAPLWKLGIDYKHGTGHGVGSQLCVHESPPGISLQCPENSSYGGLVAGMFVTNEPGYYEDGQFGIRIENLMMVVDHPTLKGFCKFETVTHVPLCRDLIVKGMLAPEEVQWVNEYHAVCLEKLKGKLAGQDSAWVAVACAPL